MSSLINQDSDIHDHIICFLGDSRAVTPDIAAEEQPPAEAEVGVVAESIDDASSKSPPLITLDSQPSDADEGQIEENKEDSDLSGDMKNNTNLTSSTKGKDQLKDNSLCPAEIKDTESAPSTSPASAKSKLTGKPRTGWI